ncbi:MULTISPECIES: hypothetical protein [Streptomyces]|uniref:hypothetical protein n=1 Tax=Streptomyces TaxID=1883 RepID=UPI0004C0E4C2|nr:MULTISPECIES: hypothetical protein [Streptomyces]MDX3274737.1 hypothetical protein [Streptomyces scabiei]MDX3848075.1 hypothetical protein [Streptomyces europaeiscabiei]
MTLPTPGQLRTLIHDALTTALTRDAATLPASMLYTPGCRPALFIDSSVVRGGPGVGKTLWARVLTDPDLRAAAAHDLKMPRLEDTRVISAPGAAGDSDGYPAAPELEALIGEGIRPVTVWTAVALTALGVCDLTHLPSWRDRAQWLLRNPDALRQAVADLNSQGHTHLVVFDSLDRLHPDQRITDRLASGVLQLAADLARLGPRVRAKVFLRPDTLDAALWALRSEARRALRTTDLNWSTPDHWGQVTGTHLYGLFFQLLANHPSEGAAAFRSLTPGWRLTPDGRFSAPEQLTSDPAAQERLFTVIADPYMGATARKGSTYRFMLTYLQDGVGGLSPRPFLIALRQAVRHALDDHPDHPRALHHRDIRRGVPDGARARAAEVEQAMPWVQAALAPLAGQQLPVDSDQVIAQWDHACLPDRLRRLGSRAADPYPSGMRHLARYHDLLEELTAAGVVHPRTDGSWDMPEPFRIAYGLGRRRGVKPASAPV